ncbi:MAG: flagellar basal body protein [Dysosmobacter sp.]
MAFLSSLNIVGSGLTAQQLRLDVISENITNQNTTRGAKNGGSYRRKMVVLESEGGAIPF